MNILEMTAPCGRDCFNCPVYLAGDNPRLRSIIAKRQNLPEEQVRCIGCRPEGGCIPFLGWTKPCALFACTEAKSMNFFQG